MFLVRMFLFSYIVTIVVETAAALIWRCRLRGLLTVLWVNMITNPCAVALRYAFNQWIYSPAGRTLVIIGIEIVVLLAEWQLFRKFLKQIKHPFLFSLTLNAASYGTGLLMPQIMSLLI